MIQAGGRGVFVEFVSVFCVIWVEIITNNLVSHSKHSYQRIAGLLIVD